MPAAVIDDHHIAIADAQRTGIAGKLLRRRQHVRQGAGMIDDAVDVEEHRAGNMRRPRIPFGRIALVRRACTRRRPPPAPRPDSAQPFGGDDVAHVFERDRDRGALLRQPGRRGQALSFQEFRIEQLALIAVAVIAQHGDDGVPRAHVLRHADGARHIDAGRAAHAQAFMLQKIEDDGQGFLIGNFIGVVDRRAFQIGGDAALADAFGDGGAMRLPARRS